MPRGREDMQVNVAGLRRNIKNLAHNYSDAQVKVREATSNDPWGPSSTLMAEIADLTYNVMAFTEIMQMIWKRLNDHGKNWRHVYKALVLMEYLIKTGSEKVAMQCKENIYAIHTLKDFQYIEEGKDQGLNVREKAKQLVNLLKDDERLKNERARALKAKQRFAQSASAFGSDGALDTPTSPTYPGGDIVANMNGGGRGVRLEGELARPLTASEEELQLQLVMAMSREEAEREERRRRSDELRLQLAISQSQQQQPYNLEAWRSLPDITEHHRNTEPSPHYPNTNEFHTNSNQLQVHRSEFYTNRSEFSANRNEFSANGNEFSANRNEFSANRIGFSTNRNDFNKFYANYSTVEVSRSVFEPRLGVIEEKKQQQQQPEPQQSHLLDLLDVNLGNPVAAPDPWGLPPVNSQPVHQDMSPEAWSGISSPARDPWAPAAAAAAPLDPWAPLTQSKNSPGSMVSSPSSELEQFDAISRRVHTNGNGNHATSSSPFDLTPLGDNLNNKQFTTLSPSGMGSTPGPHTGAIKKSPSLFLGENSALVNLEQLIPAPPASPPANPFLQPTPQPRLTINELKQQQMVVGMQPARDPWAPAPSATPNPFLS